jgi:hypothetical protein
MLLALVTIPALLERTTTAPLAAEDVAPAVTTTEKAVWDTMLDTCTPASDT